MKNYLMILRRILIASISLTMTLELSACSTAGKNPLPHEPEGLTMAEIYRQETPSTSSEYTGDEQALLTARRTALPLNTNENTTSSEVNQVFKPLPNPEIGMYVYPHLVNADGDSEPVPGYMTAFFLYKSNQFALPNELY